MQKWDLWSAYWIFVWFLAGFGVPETIALVTGHPENTLSDQVWHLEGLGGSDARSQGVFTNPAHWSFGHWMFTLGMIWLFGHFIYHIWR